MSKSADAFRTISEVAEILATPAHVLRFWESKFPQVKPVKRAGGRRYYRPADVVLLQAIKQLLHDQGMTIRGVQKILREQGARKLLEISGLGLLAETEAAAPDPAPAPVAPDPAPQRVIRRRLPPPETQQPTLDLFAAPPDDAEAPMALDVVPEPEAEAAVVALPRAPAPAPSIHVRLITGGRLATAQRPAARALRARGQALRARLASADPTRQG
ncbi:MerR family transcriptional regulator [Phaeovulum veldkampii]|uniref:MerR family transcriptional regulator n=2 Tax=Phaeovulum veldkampii TaxID=33049 RepID=A0A2T4JL56_9RHOB|nr:MerR family transcriptional regulator [Phaeovulum veldkampii]PTE18497.1 MerR family transcriptional regulator [Phaeovulum veldkampii DSM 11550]TDQ59228.1 DNA-binding transcriptional MerR regulator [Phaeovulum veldkampii DSM 11550]